MTKKMITATEECFSGYSMDGQLKSIKQHIDGLIEKYGEEAVLNFDPYHHEPYDQDPSPRSEVKVVRLETDMEYEKRTTNEATLKEKREAYERSEYERLQKKFNSTKE